MDISGAVEMVMLEKLAEQPMEMSPTEDGDVVKEFRRTVPTKRSATPFCQGHCNRYEWAQCSSTGAWIQRWSRRFGRGQRPGTLARARKGGPRAVAEQSKGSLRERAILDRTTGPSAPEYGQVLSVTSASIQAVEKTGVDGDKYRPVGLSGPPRTLSSRTAA